MLSQSYVTAVTGLTALLVRRRRLSLGERSISPYSGIRLEWMGVSQLQCNLVAFHGLSRLQVPEVNVFEGVERDLGCCKRDPRENCQVSINPYLQALALR